MVAQPRRVPVGERLVAQRLLHRGLDAGRRELERLAALFPGRLHVEIQRHHLRDEEHRNTAMLDLARRLRLPVVATGGIRYARREHKELADVLACIREGVTLDTAGAMVGSEVQLTTAQKPVIVSMGDTAASGGYYIAMESTAIVAQPATLTGSIGVVTVNLPRLGYRSVLDRLAEVEPFDLRMFLRSAPFRRRHGLLTNDSLVAATAHERGVEAIASPDRDFERLTDVGLYVPGDI